MQLLTQLLMVCTCAVSTILEFFTYRNFLVLRKCFRGHFYSALLAAALLFSLPLLALPDFLWGYMAIYSFIRLPLVCFLCFRGSLTARLCIMLTFFLIQVFSEMALLFMQQIFALLIPGNPFSVASLLGNGTATVLAVYTILLCSILFIFYRTVIPGLKKYYAVLSFSFTLKLIIPIVLSYLFSNMMILILAPGKKLTLITGTALLILFIIFSVRYVFRICRTFEETEEKNARLNMRKETLKQQIIYSRELEAKYREVRKQNHDLSNHLLTLTYLTDAGHFQEAQDYIAELLKKKEDSAV